MIDAYTLKDLLLKGDKSQAVYHIRQQENSHPYLKAIVDFFDEIEQWKSFKSKQEEKINRMDEIKSELRSAISELEDALNSCESAYELIEDV